MKKQIVVGLFSVLAVTQNAFADQEVKFTLGATAYSMMTIKNDASVPSSEISQKGGGTFGLSYERSFTDNLSWGAELQYASPSTAISKNSSPGLANSELSYKLTTTRLFANLMATKKAGGFYPYAGLGLGISQNSVTDFQLTYLANNIGGSKSTLSDKSQSSLAWQIFGGLDFDISDRLFAGFALKYMNLGQVKLGNSGTSSILDGKGKAIASSSGSGASTRLDGDMSAFELNLAVGMKI